MRQCKGALGLIVNPFLHLFEAANASLALAPLKNTIHYYQ